MCRARSRSSVKCFLAAIALAVLCLCEGAGANVPDVIVSQKGRKFDPTTIDLLKGAAIVIENDDGDLVHHAYVEADTFSFDSGDQQPGSRTRVVFPVAGDFKVLCGIHPKMKLLVHVH